MESPKFHTDTARRLQTVRNLRVRFEQIVETNGLGLYNGRLDSSRGTDLFPDTVIHVGEKRERNVADIASTLLPRLELRYQGLVRERLLELKNAGNISEDEYNEATGAKEEKEAVEKEVDAPQEKVLPVVDSPVDGSISGNGLSPQRVRSNGFNGHSPFAPSEARHIVKNPGGNGAKPAEVESSILEADEEERIPDVRSRRDFTRKPDRHYHTWHIEEPNGPTSMGVCDCGANKLFKNWLDDSDFTTNEEHRLAV